MYHIHRLKPHMYVIRGRWGGESRDGIGCGRMSAWVVPGFAEERRLGSGASGRVLAAVHMASGTRVAIKYLSPALVRDPQLLAGFRAEAELLKGLADRNVVRLYDYIDAPGHGAAIVMELVDGVSLHEMITQQGPTGPESALAVLKGSLLGLAAAHALGIVHRDYKPENVLVDREGTSKLTDFGVAARAGQSAGGGTPLYMAPEQWNGAPATPATDIYAASAVFFECLTGMTPFSGQLSQLAQQHALAEVPVGLIDEPLRDLIARGMAKDPAARPANATTLVAELESTAAAAYGAGWEERGRSQLAGRAAALLLALYGVGTAATGATGAGTGSATTTTWLGTAKTAIAAHAILSTGITAAAVGIVGGSLIAVSTVKGHSASSTVASTTSPSARPAATSAPSSAACGTSGVTALGYLTGSLQAGTRTVAVRCGTGTPRTLGTVQDAYSEAPVWSPDGTQLGWQSISTVYVAQVRAGTWTVRHWSCQYCNGLAFQGGHAVTVSEQAGGVLTPGGAIPQLLVFPVSGNGPPVTLTVTGIPASHPSTEFSVLGSVSPTDVVVEYGTHYGAHNTGTQVLYRVSEAGQATQYGNQPLDLPEAPNVIYGQGIEDFTTNAAGSTLAFYNTNSGGAACFSSTPQVLDTATGTVSTPATPAGGGPQGWEVRGMWFDQAGTPYVSLLATVTPCAAPVAGQTVLAPNTAPVVCKLAGTTWVPAGTGVFQAAYGPGHWLAEETGVSDQAGAASQTLTISDGPGTTPATVTGVTGFAWEPLNPN
jgi:tRNA A-37 threonylcarbamoyl transferase component Bud32